MKKHSSIVVPDTATPLAPVCAFREIVRSYISAVFVADTLRKWLVCYESSSAVCSPAYGNLHSHPVAELQISV